MWEADRMLADAASQAGIEPAAISLDVILGWIQALAFWALLLILVFVMVQVIGAVLYRITGWEVFSLVLAKKPEAPTATKERNTSACRASYQSSVPEILKSALSGFLWIILAPALIWIVLSVVRFVLGVV
jgi:hypothetical protein